MRGGRGHRHFRWFRRGGPTGAGPAGRDRSDRPPLQHRPGRPQLPGDYPARYRPECQFRQEQGRRRPGCHGRPVGRILQRAAGLGRCQGLWLFRSSLTGGDRGRGLRRSARLPRPGPPDQKHPAVHRGHHGRPRLPQRTAGGGKAETGYRGQVGPQRTRYPRCPVAHRRENGWRPGFRCRYQARRRGAGCHGEPVVCHRADARLRHQGRGRAAGHPDQRRRARGDGGGPRGGCACAARGPVGRVCGQAERGPASPLVAFKPCGHPGQRIQ